MRPYSIIRAGWRLLPKGIRANTQLRGLAQPLAGLFREHKQGIYHAGYFDQDVEGPALAASKVIAESLCRDVQPRRVVDVGCGSGALLAELSARGVVTVGLEYADAARDIARKRGVDARPFDVRFDALDPALERFDIACSTEVAEHLPAKYADRLVSTLTHAGSLVVFTAATPGQGGTDHVNEQPHSYWIGKFRSKGYDLDEALTYKWRGEWQQAGIAGWYWQNLMVFSGRAPSK